MTTSTTILLLVLVFAFAYQIDATGINVILLWMFYCMLVYRLVCPNISTVSITCIHIGTFLLHPRSRLVPYGAEVTFICMIQNGSNPHWTINHRSLAFDDIVEDYQQKGFHIEEQVDGITTTLTLTVNATGDKNGTEFYCSSRNTHTDSAFLFIISGKLILFVSLR